MGIEDKKSAINPRLHREILAERESLLRGPQKPDAPPAPAKAPADPVAGKFERGPSRAAQALSGLATVARSTPPGGASQNRGVAAALLGVANMDRKPSVLERIGRGATMAMLGITALSGALGLGSAPAAPVNVGMSPVAVQVLNWDQLQSTTSHRTAALPEAQAKWAEIEAQLQGDSASQLTAAHIDALVDAALLPMRTGSARELKVEAARRHLSDESRAFLTGLLDNARVPFGAEAKGYLEKVVGRVDAVDTAGTIAVKQHGQRVEGRAPAGATIEAVNLSTIPTKRLHDDDTFAAATADANGRFAADIEMKGGDIIKLRYRTADGKTSDWVTFKASGLDDRPVEVALLRFGLTKASDGQVELSNINEGRPISEPGAKIRLVNERSGAVHDIVLNDVGSFPAGTKLPGEPGDVFSVRATDGVHDAQLATELGKVRVPRADGSGGGVIGIDLADPALHKDELHADGTPRYQLVRFRGPLFEHGASPSDVVQGHIGDCYLPSAVASIAKANPQLIEDMMKQNDDGSYTVRFYRYDYRSQSYQAEHVTVDGDLYVRSWGGPIYGTTDGKKDPEDMEMWWPILEKAYAKWHGSYDTIGDGGSSSEVFTEMLGRRADDLWLSGGSADEAWSRIKRDIDAKSPLSAGTYGKSRADLYTNTGVYANHSYSIVGYAEKDGVKLVQLRNPWGESEPYPGDGKNDGVFELPLDKFVELYQTLYGLKPSAPAPGPHS